jgi:hypothetical protein
LTIEERDFIIKGAKPMSINPLITLLVLLFAVLGVGISLGVMIQNGTRETRNQINRLEDRVTGVEGNMRDRVAWIEGLLGAFTKPPDQESVFMWRGLGQTEPEGED